MYREFARFVVDVLEKELEFCVMAVLREWSGFSSTANVIFG